MILFKIADNELNNDDDFDTGDEFLRIYYNLSLKDRLDILKIIFDAFV